jgi:hypothetical protein
MVNPTFPSDLVRIADSRLLQNDQSIENLDATLEIVPPDYTEIKDFLQADH